MATFNQTKFRQDMPPPGGYDKFWVQRTFPRINPRTGKKIAVFIVATWITGWFKHKSYMRYKMRSQLELNDVRMVTHTFLTAERDRNWLNYLHFLRDEERKLMKDVPGWRVGTWYGEPIFFTLDPDQWWDPSTAEVQAHASPFSQSYREYWRVDSDMRGGPRWYDKYLPEWIARK